MGTQLYGYTADEHEYWAYVPELCDGEPSLMIAVSAHGGGTVGKAYANNGWDYMVTARGVTMLKGSGMRSPASRGATHEAMARALASILSADGESLSYNPETVKCANEYTLAEQEWLAANYERLSLFANDI